MLLGSEKHLLTRVLLTTLLLLLLFDTWSTVVVATLAAQSSANLLAWQEPQWLSSTSLSVDELVVVLLLRHVHSLQEGSIINSFIETALWQRDFKRISCA